MVLPVLTYGLTMMRRCPGVTRATTAALFLCLQRISKHVHQIVSLVTWLVLPCPWLDGKNVCCVPVEIAMPQLACYLSCLGADSLKAPPCSSHSRARCVPGALRLLDHAILHQSGPCCLHACLYLHCIQRTSARPWRMPSGVPCPSTLARVWACVLHPVSCLQHVPAHCHFPGRLLISCSVVPPYLHCFEWPWHGVRVGEATLPGPSSTYRRIRSKGPDPRSAQQRAELRSPSTPATAVDSSASTPASHLHSLRTLSNATMLDSSVSSASLEALAPNAAPMPAPGGSAPCTPAAAVPTPLRPHACRASSNAGR